MIRAMQRFSHDQYLAEERVGPCVPAVPGGDDGQLPNVVGNVGMRVAQMRSLNGEGRAVQTRRPLRLALVPKEAGALVQAFGLVEMGRRQVLPLHGECIVEQRRRFVVVPALPVNPSERGQHPRLHLRLVGQLPTSMRGALIQQLAGSQCVAQAGDGPGGLIRICPFEQADEGSMSVL
jgi:hypothetical protein